MYSKSVTVQMTHTLTWAQTIGMVEIHLQHILQVSDSTNDILKKSVVLDTTNESLIMSDQKKEDNMGLVARNLVFRISDIVKFLSVSSATETS